MSHSELIRFLLSKFLALKPKAIERLLGERGVSVDANLIGVARLRHRSSKRAERALCGLLAKLIDKRPDLFDYLQASFDGLTRQVIEGAASHPGLSESELVEILVSELPNQPPVETVDARVSRLFLSILQRHPHYRRSVEVASGLKADSLSGAVLLFADGPPDDLTDEQIEAGILQYLERNYPAGPSAEAIARAYMSKAKEKEEQDHEHRQAAEVTMQGRSETILASVLARFDSEVNDRDAAFAIVHQFVTDYPDWTDEETTERVVAGLKLLTEPEDKPVLHIEGLTIRKRPFCTSTPRKSAFN